MLLLVLAAAPAAAMLPCIYYRNRHEKEPGKLPARMLLLGFFPIMPAAFAESLARNLFNGLSGPEK